MPAAGNQLDWRTGLQLGLLLMALPAQYLIMNYSSVSPHQSQKALKDLMSQAQKVGADFLSWPAWQQWCIDVLGIHKSRSNKPGGRWTASSNIAADDFTGESPAIEVMQHEDPLGHFANSPVVRTPRPKNALYRVGQVITHKKFGYRGVIVGWDPNAKAPETWLAANHPTGLDEKRDHPNYAVLVDTRDRAQPQLTYIAQDNIQPAAKTRIMHPDITRYFDQFDGRQYIARPALKELYPDD